MNGLKLKSHKTDSIGIKILYPILFMVFFQVLIFWLFIFQLGLFDSVVHQSKETFLNNVVNNANQVNSEMWFHFSDLSSLAKPVAALEKAYLLSKTPGATLTVSPELLTELILNSRNLHADGLYLNFFDDPERKNTFLLRLNATVAQALAAKESIDFQTDIAPMISSEHQSSPVLEQFLTELKEKNSMTNSLPIYDRGSWSPILSMDGSHPALLFAIPLNYQNRQYGFLASEIFLSSFDQLLESTSFPKNFPHQTILLHHNHLSEKTEIISEKAFNMEALDAAAIVEALFDSKSSFSYSSRLLEHKLNGKKYFSSVQLLTYASPEYIPLSESSFYYITLSPRNTVMKEANLLSQTFIFLIILFILFSVIIALYITKQVVFPISQLTAAIKRKEFPQKSLLLPQTKITEIDILTNTIFSQNQNILGFHQMIADTLIASETKLVTFYTDTILNITRGFGTFQALLGKDFANENILTFTAEDFAALEKSIYEDFVLYSSYSSELEDGTIQTDIYFDRLSHKYVCVKSRELKDGRSVVMLDYTSYVLEQEKIKKERDYDVLTSLLNRFSFSEKATNYLTEHPQSPVCMAMWDLDFLKSLNDTYGHDVGDLYLRQAGKILQELNPEKSFVARVSGDEFFAFLFDYPDKAAAVHDIAAVHQKLNSSSISLPNGSKYAISASCGYIYSVGSSYEELRKFADSAMYQSKKSIKGSIHEFVPEELS